MAKREKSDTRDVAFQSALGWTNSHLHEFVIGVARYSDPDPDMVEEVQHDERQDLLRGALGKVK